MSVNQLFVPVSHVVLPLFDMNPLFATTDDSPGPSDPSVKSACEKAMSPIFAAPSNEM